MPKENIDPYQYEDFVDRVKAEGVTWLRGPPALSSEQQDSMDLTMDTDDDEDEDEMDMHLNDDKMNPDPDEDYEYY